MGFSRNERWTDRLCNRLQLPPFPERASFPKSASIDCVRGIFGNGAFEALKNGSRLRLASEIRSEISGVPTQEHGLTFSESAGLSGVSASAVAKRIMRKGIKT